MIDTLEFSFFAKYLNKKENIESEDFIDFELTPKMMEYDKLLIRVGNYECEMEDISNRIYNLAMSLNEVGYDSEEDPYERYEIRQEEIEAMLGVLRVKADSIIEKMTPEEKVIYLQISEYYQSVLEFEAQYRAEMAAELRMGC